MNASVKPTLESYAAEKDVKLELVDSLNTASKLVEQVETFINKNVDALVINLVDPGQGEAIINMAKEADIPLVLYNKETNHDYMSGYDDVYYVGIRSNDFGVAQGELIAEDIIDGYITNRGDGGSEYTYLLMKGESGHVDAEARTTLSQSTITDMLNADTNGYTIKIGSGIQDSQSWSTTDAFNAMNIWLSNPTLAANVDFVICNNDALAEGIVQSLRTHESGWGGLYPGENDIKVYGNDGIATTLQLIADGAISGTVYNDGPNQARAAIDVALAAIAGDLTSDLQDVEGYSTWTFDTNGSKAIRVPAEKIGRDHEMINSLTPAA